VRDAARAAAAERDSHRGPAVSVPGRRRHLLLGEDGRAAEDETEEEGRELLRQLEVSPSQRPRVLL